MSIDSSLLIHNLDILEYFDTGKLPDGVKFNFQSGGSEMNSPLFFTATEGEDLIIAIRGATELNDYAIVLDLKNEEILNGQGHRGIIRVSRFIIDKCMDLIANCTGTIKVMGHSLGGATTVGISTILKLELGFENVTGYSLAAFPVFSKSIADQTRDFITSVIYGMDIVPKLSNKNMCALINMMAPPGPQQEAAKANLVQTITRMLGGAMSPENMSFVGSKLEQVYDLELTLISDAPVLSGTLIQIMSRMNEKQEKVPFVRPYDENTPLDMFSMLMGVSQHLFAFYTKEIHALYAPKPCLADKPAGPAEIDDLD